MRDTGAGRAAVESSADREKSWPPRGGEQPTDRADEEAPAMAIDVRPHQSLGMSLIREAFGQYRRVLFVAPTAFGKTVTFSAISASATQLGRRIVIIAHRQELIDQISRTLAWFDVDHGIISPQ